MTRRTQFILAGLACLLALLVWKNEADRPVEGLLYNWKCRVAAKNDTPHKDIIVVKITDNCLNSMKHQGRWPWKGPLIAGILNYCSEARVIGMDILFSEPMVRSDLLGEEIRNGNVVSAVHFSYKSFDPEPPPELLTSTLPNWPRNQETPTFISVIPPIPEVKTNSARMGYVNFWRSSVSASHSLKLATHIEVPDASGEKNTVTLPSLALATFMVAQNLGPEELVVEDGWLKAGAHRIRVDEESNLLISWKGGDFATVDAGDLLTSFNLDKAGRAKPMFNEIPIRRDTFKDKIVLIGMEATGVARDREATPVDREMPGVFIHATAIDNLLKSESIQRLSKGRTIGLILAFGLFPALLSFRKPVVVLVCIAALIVALVAASVLLVAEHKLMIPIVLPLLALIASTSLIGVVQWRNEQRQLHRMEQLDIQKQRFTDMLVHDLKNTVAPVLMSVDLVRRSPDGDFATEDFPYYVEQTYNQLLMQVNSILDIRKMEEGRLKITTELASPLELVYAIRSEYQGAFERMELYMDVEEAEAPHTKLHLDAVMVRRVLENLIWNAIKYASNGTPIDVFCGIVGPHYAVRIANKCRPINAEKLDQIFGRYVVGNAPRTIGNITSSGLGLAFCKLAVEAHNGMIELASPVPGRKDGFQVQIRLPLKLASDRPD